MLLDCVFLLTFAKRILKLIFCRGVKVDFWQKEEGADIGDVRNKDPDLIKDFTTDAANFYKTLYFENTKPGSLYE